MNKKLSVALIVFGLILLSLGCFGTFQGFTFAVTSWSDNFNDGVIDTQRWTVTKPAGTDIKEEGGRLKLIWTTGTGSPFYMSTGTLDMASGKSVKINNVGSSANGEMWLYITTGTVYPFDYYLLVKQISTNKIFCKKSINHVESTVKQDTFSTVGGTLELKHTTDGKIEWYCDGRLIFSEAWQQTTNSLYVKFGGYWGQANYPITLELDDFVYSGDGTPPQTGSLNVKGYYDGVAVAMTNVYYAMDGSTSTPMSVPASGYTWSALAVGSYTVYGTYQGTTKQTTVSVVAGPAYAQLVFAGEPPPDPLKWLKDILNDPMVKNGMLFGGAGLVGIGFVTLVYPKKKRYAFF